MGEDLGRLDATAQAHLVCSGQVSPRELVTAAIDRIERVDPQLNAVVRRRFDQALREADAPRRGRSPACRCS
jgi:amidase